MSSENSLEQLSSKQLHDLAVSRARRHFDVRFFWDLLKYLPVAEAGAGKLDEAEADLESVIAHVDDVTDAGEGVVGDLLRPFYLEYLEKHGVEAP
jgi:hypothetical protein